MNLLTNCGYLDGATGWAGTAQLTLAIDESVRGSAGRAALVGTGSSTATNQKQALACAVDARAEVVEGVEYEVTACVFASVNGVAVAPAVAVVWRGAGGSTILTEPLTVAAPQIALHGEARLGVRNSWRRLRARLTAPAGAASADLEVAVTPAASGTAVEIALLKPLIAETWAPWPVTFDPGQTSNPDLDLPIWPSALRGFDLGPGGEPQADRVEFGEGPGRPSRRRTTADPARQFSGALRCDPVERAVLEDFHRGVGDFWFVEPDSDRLCIASFAADGAPRMTEDRGEVSTVSVGLWLETA